MSVDMVICKRCNSYFSTEDGKFRVVKGETRITCPDCGSLRVYDAEMCPVCFEMKPKGEACPHCRKEVENLFTQARLCGFHEYVFNSYYTVACRQLANGSFFIRVFNNGENYSNLVVCEIHIPDENKKIKSAIKEILQNVKEN